MKKTYNKIVRTKIPEIIEQSNKKAEYTYVSSMTFEGKLLIRNKLNEEFNELLESNSIDDIIEESADLLEVILLYLGSYDVSYEQLETVRRAKKITKGGFTPITSLHGTRDSLVKLESVEEKA